MQIEDLKHIKNFIKKNIKDNNLVQLVLSYYPDLSKDFVKKIIKEIND